MKINKQILRRIGNPGGGREEGRVSRGGESKGKGEKKEGRAREEGRVKKEREKRGESKEGEGERRGE